MDLVMELALAMDPVMDLALALALAPAPAMDPVMDQALALAMDPVMVQDQALDQVLALGSALVLPLGSEWFRSALFRRSFSRGNVQQLSCDALISGIASAVLRYGMNSCLAS